VAKVIIGFGSNLGDRRKNINKAFRFLSQQETKIIKVSSLLESEPAEGVSGGSFINGAALIETELETEALLRLLQNVEERIGRPRPHSSKDARLIDLDIIYYEDRVVNKKTLKIPHPRRLERWFVMEPAAEAAPNFRDPVLKKSLIVIASEVQRGNPT